MGSRLKEITYLEKPNELIFPISCFKSADCISRISESFVFVHAVMTSCFALLNCVGCSPHVTSARQAPYRLCNAQRVHSQRQLISLRSFTSQQPAQSRCSHIKTQAGLHGDDWSTAPDSYLTLVCLSATNSLFLAVLSVRSDLQVSWHRAWRIVSRKRMMGSCKTNLS